MADDDDKGGLAQVSDAMARELGIPMDNKPENEAESPRPTVDFSEAGEGLPTGEMHEQSPEELAAQKKRNIAIALAVLGFVVLVYLTTFFRLSQNLQNGGAG